MKKILISALVLFSVSAFADGVDMDISIQGSDVYRVDGKRLEGDFSRISGNIAIEVRQDGQTQNVNMPIPLTQAPNDTRIEVVGKNRVRITEATQGIDAVVPAVIKKKMSGKIKSLKISSESYLIAMRPVLEKQGLDMLQGFDISSDDASLSLDLDMSDINCALNETKDLECDSSLTIKISVEAN